MKSVIARQEERFAVKLITPTILVVGALILYPLIYNIYLSFFELSIAGKKTFVGIQNFLFLFSRREFYNSLWLTAQFLISTVLGTTLFGLAVALLMNLNFFGNKFVQTLILLPYFAPVISVVFGWQFIFDPVNGFYNYWIVDVLKLTSERRNILGDPQTAMLILVLFNIWKYYPITYLLILSRLKAIDKNQYEAARIDGANRWQSFLVITLPEVSFTLGTVILLRMLWNLNRFEDIFLLSPDTNILPVYIYKQAFSGVPDQGLSAAIAIIQLLLVGAFIWIYVKKILKW